MGMKVYDGSDGALQRTRFASCSSQRDRSGTAVSTLKQLDGGGSTLWGDSGSGVLWHTCLACRFLLRLAAPTNRHRVLRRQSAICRGRCRG